MMVEGARFGIPVVIGIDHLVFLPAGRANERASLLQDLPVMPPTGVLLVVFQLQPVQAIHKPQATTDNHDAQREKT